MDMPLQTKADARIGKYSGLPLELLVETLQDEESSESHVIVIESIVPCSHHIARPSLASSL